MAQLQRHPSLRFSVFELAVDIGLDTALDGNFAPITEEDESESPVTSRQQRQTQSSDELTDSPYPLTPPSGHDAVISTRPLALASDHPEDRPRFIEQFPSSSPDPLFASSKPTTPRTAPGKLRKAQTPIATTPASEPLRSGFDTDTEKDGDSPQDMKNKRRKDEAKEREKSAKGVEAVQQVKRGKGSPRIGRDERPAQTDDDEKKQLLGGLLRFRTRSKERKAAAKQGPNQVTPPLPEIIPSKPRTPPPLPIAQRFVRNVDEIAFRPHARESGSSHGGTTSVGHGSSTSIDTHDYPRPRDRSSRYERPHPAWRTGPSTLGNMGLNTLRVGNSDQPPPPEVYTYPPGQTIFDREPVKPQLRVDTSKQTSASTEAPSAIDVDALNRYYGIAPADPVPVVPSAPSPSSHVALAQALTPLDVVPNELKSNSRSTPVPGTPVPVSPSPYIVPSPNPSQMEFLPPAQPRERRGRLNVPPALDPGLMSPRRFKKPTGESIPPPTPPPTTELPPIPPEFSSPPASSSRPSPLSPQQQRSRLSPPVVRPGPPSPLGMRSSSPNLSGTTTLGFSPANSQRPGTAPQEGAPSSSLSPRPVSPLQRGKTSPFPSRPITPTRPITPVRRPQSPQQQLSQPTQQRAALGSPERTQMGGYLLNRRPEYDPIDSNQMRERPHDVKDVFTRPSEDSLGPSPIPASSRLRMGGFGNAQQTAYMSPRVNNQNDSAPTFARKRSQRRSNYQSGYDSDDTDSRYSRDTYYGRETAYFDDQNMPPLPGMEGNVPPLPTRNFSDMEQERQAGRARLIRMLASREI
ncbi:hypothetical protein FRC17_000273 [Serendipita sp. 399]|nr:hypothetical protein FRC17_000273 [Serendipita sp. 399]